MRKVALIGPPYGGKTTLFRAIADPSGATIDARPDQPHLAMVKAPDPRLDWLSSVYKPRKTIAAELEFIDMPGLDLSDEVARSHWKRNWATVRDCDMIVIVVRDFNDDSVASYRGRVDPVSDAGEILSEMLFSDLEQVQNRIERLEAQLKKPANHDATQRELDLMARLFEALENEQPIRDAIKNADEEKILRSFAFLSLKSCLVVVNSDEDRLAEPCPEIEGAEAVRLSALIECELAQLDPEDRIEFMADLGIDTPARDLLIRRCYEMLGLVSMFTVGPDECRVWTLEAGSPAVEAAGEIHSDIARGFIRAETFSYDELKAADGDEKAVKAAGKFRLEGKQYIVQDGDIVNFRFNV